MEAEDDASGKLASCSQPTNVPMDTNWGTCNYACTGERGANQSSRKRARTQVLIPRVLKNDIRRHYAPMFMNTINSADIRIMQDFFNTFMTRPCRLVGDQAMSPQFGFPDRIIAEGPRLTAHYLLGVFLMFPDLVVNLVDSKIITSNTWTGTKIVLEVDVRGTKVSALPVEAWIPPRDCLHLLYQQPSLESMVSLVRSSSPGYYESIPPVPTSNSTSSNYSGSNGANGSNNGNAGNSVSGDVRQNVTVILASPSTSPPTALPYYGRTYIPPHFIGRLCEGMQPLAQALSVHSTGKIEFYLDENNHIQHVNMRIMQQAMGVTRTEDLHHF